MTNIATLLLEQSKRAYPTLTYDNDYNILKTIIEHCCRKEYDPIEYLVKKISDEALMSKVRAWMAGAGE